MYEMPHLAARSPTGMQETRTRSTPRMSSMAQAFCIISSPVDQGVPTLDAGCGAPGYQPFSTCSVSQFSVTSEAKVG